MALGAVTWKWHCARITNGDTAYVMSSTFNWENSGEFSNNCGASGTPTVDQTSGTWYIIKAYFHDTSARKHHIRFINMLFYSHYVLIHFNK